MQQNHHGFWKNLSRTSAQRAARLGGFRKTKLEPKDLGGGKELNIVAMS